MDSLFRKFYKLFNELKDQRINALKEEYIMCKICWESREQQESFERSQWAAYNERLDRYMEKPIRKKIRNKGLADRILEELDRGYYGEY